MRFSSSCVRGTKAAGYGCAQKSFLPWLERCYLRPIVKSFAKTTLAATVVLLLTASSLHAIGTARLRISANGGLNWITALDFDGDGNLSYSGAIGNNWTVSVAGSTKPATGSSSFPELDLSSLSVSGVGTLVIEFSDIGFTELNAGNLFKTSLQSDGGSSTTVRTYMGYDNTLFQRSTLLGSITQTGTAGEQTVTTTPPNDNLYSLTLRMTIIHNALGVSTFGASLTDPPGAVAVPVPEGGSTVLILGFGLLAIAAANLWIKRFRRA